MSAFSASARWRLSSACRIRQTLTLRSMITPGVAVSAFAFMANPLAAGDVSAATVSPLPSTVTSAGPTWSTFVSNALAALGATDDASTISLSNANGPGSGSLTFSQGTYAGETVTTSTITGLVSDSKTDGLTSFTLLNNSDGLVERISGCSSSEGATAESVSCIVTSMNFTSASDQSPASTQVQTQDFSYAPTNGAAATDVSGVTPDDSSACAGYYHQVFEPAVVPSDYGPLIAYGGTFGCGENESSLGILDGLYNYNSCCGYVGTGYQGATTDYKSSAVTSYPNYAPCDAPYGYTYFETSQLEYVNGDLAAGGTATSLIPCEPLTVTDGPIQ